MIVNLTQHPASPEQRAAGVVDLPEADLPRLRELLTFDVPPSDCELWVRAHQLALMAASMCAGEPHALRRVMCGGAPFLMEVLARYLRDLGMRPCYAFSRRESVEVADPDTGAVTKRSVFRHLGFVDPT